MKKTQKLLRLYPSVGEAARERHQILASLSTDLNVDHESWVGEVRTFASRYGVLPFEFDRALDTLVGKIPTVRSTNLWSCRLSS